MGSAIVNTHTQTTPSSTPLQISIQLKQHKTKQEALSIDVIEVANIALAIKHREHTINVELSVSCKNLFVSKAFQSISSQTIVFQQNLNEPETEIGRTEIIRNEANPNYLTSFMLSFNSNKQQEIIFRIYNISKPEFENDITKQTLIGTAREKLEILHAEEFYELTVTPANSNQKEKIVMKVNCAEYDGGTSKYQIDLEISKFVGKMEIIYFIETTKGENDWIPLAKSKAIEIKKNTKFETVRVSTTKFAGENARVRVKIFDVSKSKEEEEIGCTDQLTLTNLITGDEKIGEGYQAVRVKKNEIMMGNIHIAKWKKEVKDSFISYIVNKSRLHLILGIDYTNSNFLNGDSLHHEDESKNLYITAIKEIVGVLQYFDYYNQIALYGFGAKLPPHHKVVGQCFALNGNFFNPIVVGGVEEIVRLYKENLKKVKPHGPTKLSDIIDIAMQFAQSEYQSTNYYVLILLTDGQINDYANTVDKIIEAANLPLSIILVGLGDRDFTLIQKLDQEKQILKSETTNIACDRDMIDFINFKEFIGGEKTSANEISLARKTFSQIPSQFINYMTRKNIKPNWSSSGKKDLKEAKADFITQKIKENKESLSRKSFLGGAPQFLENKMKIMIKELIALGFDPSDPLLSDMKISINDLSYFIEIHSNNKQPQKPEPPSREEFIAIRDQKLFEEFLEQKEDQRNQKIQKQLGKRITNQYGRREQKIENQKQAPIKIKKKLHHPCLKCGENEICILYFSCGHLPVCQKCQSNICLLCKTYNSQIINIHQHQINDC